MEQNRTNSTGDVSSVTVQKSTNATAYTRGLLGTSQYGNFFFINLIVAFFFGLCAVVLVVRLALMGSNHLRHLLAIGSGRERQEYWAENHTSWWPWIKRHVLYAPLGKRRHNKEIQLSSAISVGTLPSRFHFTLIAFYFISNIAYCLVLDYKQSKPALLAELRGRSGALATLNLIPTVIFAFRNNPFIPLLRVSFDTFNLLHRWAARIVLVESIIHVFAWGSSKIDASGWSGFSESFHDAFMNWGTVATVLMLFITIQAWSPVRHAFYETFINIHRLAALFAFIGVYVHCDKGHLPQLPYIQLVFALWAFEWVFRSGRIVWYNFSRNASSRVIVEALPSEACRITFELVRPWSFRPGSHVHAYLPSVGLWSSHPFSVAWADDIVLRTSMSEKLPISEKDKPMDFDGTLKTRTNISLITRARAGMTRKLYLRALAAPKKTFTTFGLVEGPYAGHEPLDSYGTVLLFAGGVGITHQIGYIRHLVAGAAAGTVATRKIVLIWTVPSTEALEWIRPWMDEILKMKGRRDILQIRLFVTKPRNQNEVVSGTGTVQMFPGRCDPQAAIDKEMLDRIGSMCVTVCGPGAFADDVRSAVRRRVQFGDIDFIEEAFTY
ncbi:MAG: hypothetical protein M1828_005068 [Chrysothrix sp. TS-e1954]|nr:MAG: hypothetical protein M1828_005068 [Chrysothrix sp. TS-e1954]